MTPLIAPDVSYYQPVVNDTFSRDWLIFRACDGSFRDPHFVTNYRWARKAAAKGKIDGFTVYIVFRPGVNTLAVLKSMVGTPDPHMTVMIDVESWGGQIRGNRSTAITKLATDLAHWLGSPNRVLAYANEGDFANLFPHRPPWLRLIRAKYSSQRPSMPHMVGWQYTDGQKRWPVPRGYPRSSKPFGSCDHNVFPGHTGATLAHLLGVGPVKPAENHDAPTVRPSPVAKPSSTPRKEIDMPMLVSVKNPGGKTGIHLLDGGKLMHVTTPADWRGFEKRLGPAIPISESQFLALGGKR